jgi:hypothetical protein
MNQFTCKGVKQINNQISLNMTFTFTIRISRRFSYYWWFIHVNLPAGAFVSKSSAREKNQVPKNLDLHFAINISGNSPFGLNPRWIHCTFDRNKKFSSASKVVRLVFAQRFITIFNCRYHTSNRSICLKIFRPWKKSSTKKSWSTFCDQYFWKFPIWNSRAEEKRREIRMVKVNVIFNDIWLLIFIYPTVLNLSFRILITTDLSKIFLGVRVMVFNVTFINTSIYLVIDLFDTFTGKLVHVD